MNYSYTILDIIDDRATNKPDQEAYRFLKDDGDIEVITYSMLRRKSKILADELIKRGAQRKCVLICLSPGIDFIVGFFGCMYAGSVAVPTPPPRRNDVTFFNRIVKDTGAEVCLSNSQLVKRISNSGLIVPSLSWCNIEELNYSSNLQNQDRYEPNISSTAFIQYTSGSTSEPKGVLISHKNIMNNSSLIAKSFGHSQSSRGVIWLPPYHDMGLIGGIIQPLYVGFPVLLMSPFTFAQDPYKWLESITQFKATTSGAPNFAYDLCVKRISRERREHLDLSSWEVAFVGAETNNSETLSQFASEFGSYGFHKRSFFACYGLAENTLLVTGQEKNEGLIINSFNKQCLAENSAIPSTVRDKKVIELVSCGRPVEGVDMKIVDIETDKICDDNSVGEVWLSGQSVAKGYFQNYELTQEIFNAHLFGEKEQMYLKTGDLGFIHKGELYIVGRIKDVMKFRGKNYYPQDFETISENTHASLIKNGCAVFMAGEDKALCIVQEIHRHNKEDTMTIMGKIHHNISASTGISPSFVVLVREGSIPKTTSGKIRRRETRERFLSSALKIISQFNFESLQETLTENGDLVSHQTHMANVSDVKQVLIHIKKTVSNLSGFTLDHISSDQLLTFYGVDSLKNAELISNLNSTFNVYIPSDVFFNETIEEVANNIVKGKYKYESKLGTDTTIENSEIASIDQKRLWMMEQVIENTQPYLLKIGIELQGEIDSDLAEKCIHEIVNRHSSLRTNFILEDSSLIRNIKTTWTEFHITKNVSDVLEKTESILNNLSTLDWTLDKGELFKVFLISDSYKNNTILFVGHHIIVDLYSLQIIQKEFCQLYCESITNQRPTLLQTSKQFGDYLLWYNSEIKQKEKQLEVFWSGYLKGAKLTCSKINKEKDDFTVRNVNHWNFTVSKKIVESLSNYAKEYNATSFMVMVSCFYICLFKYLEEMDVTISIPTSGRKHHSFSNTVGFLARPTLFRANASIEDTFKSFFSKVREDCLRVYENELYPYTKMIEIYRANNNTEKFISSQIMLNYITNGFNTSTTIPNVNVNQLQYIGHEQLSDYDLCLTLLHKEDQINGTITFNKAVFKSNYIQQFTEDFLFYLSNLASNTELKLGEILDNSIQEYSKNQVIISSNFTAEPVIKSMEYFKNKLENIYEIKFAAYNQVFSELLSPTSSFYINSFINVVLIRLEDWYQESGNEFLQRNVSDFINALRTYGDNHQTPVIIIFCPYSEKITLNVRNHSQLVAAEQVIIENMESYSNLYFTSSTTLLELYPLSMYNDDDSYQLSKSPYIDEFYSVIGTYLTRKIYSIINPDRFKVIVVDADQTLWEGVCGEQHPLDLIVSPARMEFHRLLVDLHQKGVLLCLCSKNNENDIKSVFEIRNDILIKPEHFIVMKVNWKSKADNLLEISEELNLSISDFIFIDDNPVECAEIKALSEEITVFHFPTKEEDIQNFIKHSWAFDKARVTLEDTQRNEFYKKNYSRRKLERTTLSFKQFLMDLGIKITLRGIATNEDLYRTSQLTFRTNQFNFTQLKLSEMELLAYKQNPLNEVAVIEVTDRFGDYGLVGAVFMKRTADILEITNVLLSCRVLGKTVEYEVFKWIAERTVNLGYEKFLVLFSESSRNQPAGNCLNKLLTLANGKQTRLGFEFKPDEILKWNYWNLFNEDLSSVPKEPHIKSLVLKSKPSYNELFFPDIAILHQSIKNSNNKLRDSYKVRNEYVPPQSHFETVLVEIWKDILGLDQVGINDNFFELGGHSLLATQVIGRFKVETNIEVPLRIIFSTDPTIKSWSEAIDTFIEEENNDLNMILEELEGIDIEDLNLLLAEMED